MDFLIDTGETFSHPLKGLLSEPVTSESIQQLESASIVSSPMSQPTLISSGPLNTHHAFPVSTSSPASLLLLLWQPPDRLWLHLQLLAYLLLTDLFIMLP